MTIAQAFNEITIAQGGTASTSGTIAGAIDALNDALAGSDQQAAQSIESAVRLLGQHIGGGGSSVTVEALTATENKTYTAPEGKAYSPVTVNVSGGGAESEVYLWNVNNDENFGTMPSAIYCVSGIGDNDYTYTELEFETVTHEYMSYTFKGAKFTCPSGSMVMLAFSDKSLDVLGFDYKDTSFDFTTNMVTFQPTAVPSSIDGLYIVGNYTVNSGGE